MIVLILKVILFMFLRFLAMIIIMMMLPREFRVKLTTIDWVLVPYLAVKASI